MYLGRTAGAILYRQRFAQWAQEKRGSFNSGTLFGYVAAVSDSNRAHLCRPREGTLGQTVDIVAQYLDKHPASRHRDADTLVVLALNAAWPCPEKKP